MQLPEAAKLTARLESELALTREIGISERLISESVKRDRLIDQAGCRIVRDFRCSVVVAITGAVHFHRAGAGAAGHGDVVAGPPYRRPQCSPRVAHWSCRRPVSR